MFSKLIFDLNKVMLDLKDFYKKNTNEKIKKEDVKEISMLFEIF